jgi:hypothetical protein
MNAIKMNSISFTKLVAHRGKRLTGVFLQILILLALLVGTAGSAYAETAEVDSTPGAFLFTTERIDAPRMYHWMRDRSLRLDTNKRPHIAYGGDNLYYLHFNGSSWIYETIDPSPGTGKYASLALDNNNRPHVSYYDIQRGALKYARKMGSVWEIFTVDAPPGFFSTFDDQESRDVDGENLDSFGEVRDWFFGLYGQDGFSEEFPSGLEGEASEIIVEMIQDDYEVDQSEPDILEKEAAQIEVEIQAAINETGRGLFSSIAVNNASVPFISYYDAGGGDLKIARWTGTAWDIRTLDSTGNVGLYTSLGLDSNGNPHISYYDATLGNLKYLRWTGSAWSTPVVVDNGGGTNRYVGLYSSITLDPDRNPHISYYDTFYRNLKYARLTSGNWLTYVIDNGANVGLHTSIALDASRRVFISYYNAESADLKLASCTNMTCSLQTVVAAGTVGLFTSLVLDGSNPRISFYEANSGYLKYAFFSGGTWVIQNIDRAGDVGHFSSMTLNQDGHPHIAYYDEVTRKLKYAYWDGGQWRLSYVDEASEAGRYASLALHPVNGQARISYYDLANRSLKYAAWTGTNWSIQVVDAGPDVGLHSALALDPSGQPRIAYCRGRGCATGSVQDGIELRAAVFTGSSWVIRTVAGGGVGLFTDIAVDKTGAIHLSSYDAAARILKYAKGTPDGSSWNVQTADGGTKVGLFTSIAVDSANNPHIAYLDDNVDGLRYAFWNGAWQTTLVDRQAPVGWFPSIELDKDGNPHISYYDFGKRVLKYTRKAGSSWLTQVVDGGSELGRYSSLALKDGITPVISYYDATNGDLKFATAKMANQIFLPVIRK